MTGSDWLLLGGLGLGAYLLLSNQGSSASSTGQGIDPSTGLPFGGGAGAGGWPTSFPSPTSSGIDATAPAPGGWFSRFQQGATSPENLGFLAAATVAGAGGTLLFAKRGVTGTRGETELPESLRTARPNEPPEITVRKPNNALDFTQEFAASPRAPTEIDLPSTFSPRLTKPSTRFTAIRGDPFELGGFTGQGLAAGGALETVTALAQVPGAARQAAALQATGRSNPSASALATSGVFGGFQASQANVNFARAHPIEAVPVLASKGAANIAVGTAQAVAHPINTVVGLGNNLSNLIKPGSGTFRWTGFHW